MTQFSVVDDCLQVGGMPLTRLAQRVGTTPFYAYDRGLISARVAALREHLPRAIHLHYAMKANPMPAVVQHLSRLVERMQLRVVHIDHHASHHDRSQRPVQAHFALETRTPVQAHSVLDKA
jgi:hypothetical protein